MVPETLLKMPPELVVLWAAIRLRDWQKDGEPRRGCTASVMELAGSVGVSERMVRENISRLEDCGAVAVQRVTGFPMRIFCNETYDPAKVRKAQRWDRVAGKDSGNKLPTVPVQRVAEDLGNTLPAYGGSALPTTPGNQLPTNIETLLETSVETIETQPRQRASEVAEPPQSRASALDLFGQETSPKKSKPRANCSLEAAEALAALRRTSTRIQWPRPTETMTGLPSAQQNAWQRAFQGIKDRYGTQDLERLGKWFDAGGASWAKDLGIGLVIKKLEEFLAAAVKWDGKPIQAANQRNGYGNGGARPGSSLPPMTIGRNDRDYHAENEKWFKENK